MPTTLDIVARLILAGLLGGIVGLERKAHLKDAGLRTHFVVSVGGALFMIVSKYAFIDVVGIHGIVLDPSRVAAQVVSGIGFLGAGTIIFQRNAVRGLTTAAGLWTTAGIGLAAGSGLYVISICGALLVTGGLIGLKWLERRLVGSIDQVSIVGHNSSDMIARIGDALLQIHVNIERIELEIVEKESVTIGLYLKATRQELRKEQIAQALSNVQGVEQLHFGGRNNYM